MIQLIDIDVSFKSELKSTIFAKNRQQILHKVGFEVKEGSCVGILGESGSGKSTTGRVLCSLLKPDRGSVLFNNIDVYKDKAGKKLLQENMSIVFQDYTTSVNPRFKVKQIIAESLNVYKRRSNISIDIEKEVSEFLLQVGLDESLKDRFPHQLSGGQLQRVCIARAIAGRPKVILFDEAISSLDAHTQVQMMDLLLELKDRYKLTYIFITHDLTAITYLCDEVLFLYQGRITAHSAISELSNIQDEYANKLLDSMIDY